MFQFLKDLFSDEGKPDIGALCSLLITTGVLGWITHVVYHTHAIPDLGGPSAFLGVGAASHYGVNKVNDVVSAFKGNGSNGNGVAH